MSKLQELIQKKSLDFTGENIIQSCKKFKKLEKLDWSTEINKKAFIILNNIEFFVDNYTLFKEDIEQLYIKTIILLSDLNHISKIIGLSCELVEKSLVLHIRLNALAIFIAEKRLRGDKLLFG